MSLLLANIDKLTILRSLFDVFTVLLLVQLVGTLIRYSVLLVAVTQNFSFIVSVVDKVHFLGFLLKGCEA